MFSTGKNPDLRQEEPLREAANQPCAGSLCDARDVGFLNFISPPPPANSAAIADVKVSTVEKVLEKGLNLAEASPTHLAFRGTTDPGSVRCEWRGVARTTAQPEQALRFWLNLAEDDTLPAAAEAEAERKLIAALDQTNPIYPETMRATFRELAQGGLTPSYKFLTCYADYTVQEYLLGNVSGNPTKITVAYDRQQEARSFELYRLAHAAGEFGEQPLWSSGKYQDYLNQRAISFELLLGYALQGRESVVFLAPMGAHNAIAVEAWQSVSQWDLEIRTAQGSG